MNNKKDLAAKVIFNLNPEEWHGSSTETLWADKTPNGLLEITNTPFFVNRVSYKDLVSAEEKDGVFYYIKTVTFSGHSTYRILVSKNANTETLDKYWLPLKELGCTYESSQMGLLLLAVDVPTKADILKVYSLLEEGEDNDAWSFQEGHCAHSLE